ncbi:MAG: DUF1634 domain-containing protein [Bryobacteraceae bacterium]
MTDERLDSIIANLLRGGVTLSAALAFSGGIWYLAESGRGIVHYGRFQAGVCGLRGLARLPGPQALIFAGLLLLIATPVARVACSLVAFALERDRVYVVCTLLVLAVLLYSIGTALW